MIVLDSITFIDDDVAGETVVAASHGGLYAAAYGASHGARALILNDAGVGRDRAGISGLAYLDRYGIAGATVGYETCRIGDGRDMLERGIISYANDAARRAGCLPGLTCRAAAAKISHAVAPVESPPEPSEARHLISAGPPEVWAIDSASLVLAEDAHAVVVTASHGALIPGHEKSPLGGVAPLGALFNDAGIGMDQAGISRLQPLAEVGVPAATVSAASARIGDSRSTYEDGILSAVNSVAKARGARPGMTARAFVDIVIATR